MRTRTLASIKILYRRIFPKTETKEFAIIATAGELLAATEASALAYIHHSTQYVALASDYQRGSDEMREKLWIIENTRSFSEKCVSILKEAKLETVYQLRAFERGTEPFHDHNK